MYLDNLFLTVRAQGHLRLTDSASAAFAGMGWNRGAATMFAAKRAEKVAARKGVLLACVHRQDASKLTMGKKLEFGAPNCYHNYSNSW